MIKEIRNLDYVNSLRNSSDPSDRGLATLIMQNEVGLVDAMVEISKGLVGLNDEKGRKTMIDNFLSPRFREQGQSMLNTIELSVSNGFAKTSPKQMRNNFMGLLETIMGVGDQDFSDRVVNATTAYLEYLKGQDVEGYNDLHKLLENRLQNYKSNVELGNKHYYNVK
tara:strand:- start:90 stop:590 length:501 start_codon:yes stop_codon:yes gene_type:complete